MFNRVLPEGSLRRFIVSEILLFAGWVLGVVAFSVVFIFVGHVMEKRYPSANGAHAHNMKETDFSWFQHYFVEFMIGFVICVVIVCLAIMFITAFVLMPFFVLSEWYTSFKKYREDVQYSAQPFCCGCINVGSPVHFVLFVMLRLLVFLVVVIVTFYPVSMLGNMIIGAPPQQFEFSMIFFVFYTVGSLACIFGIITLGMILICITCL